MPFTKPITPRGPCTDSTNPHLPRGSRLRCPRLPSVTRLPLFLRFGCSWIFTACTAISLAHPWTFTVRRYSKQAPACILARMQELAIRSTRLHPRTCFSAAENWLIIRGFPSTASGVKTAIMPPLGSTFRPVLRFEAWTRVEKSAFGEGIKTEATDFAPCNEA